MAYQPIDFDTLDAIQLRLWESDHDPAVVEELAAFGRESASDIWASAAAVVSTQDERAAMRWKNELVDRFGHLGHSVSFFQGSFTFAMSARTPLSESLFEADELRHIQRFFFEGDPLAFGRGEFDESMGWIGRSDKLDGAIEMVFAGNGISPRGVAHFLTSGRRHNLRRLEFSWEEVEAEGLVHLAGAPDLAGLRELHIEFAALDGQLPGIEALGRAAFAGTLQVLRLRSTYLEADSIEALGRHHRLLEPLRVLDFGGPVEGWNKFGDDGLEMLAACDSLQNLERLDIGACEVGDRGLQALLESPNFPNLRVLDLGESTEYAGTNHHSDEMVAKLQARFPVVNDFAE